GGKLHAQHAEIAGDVCLPDDLRGLARLETRGLDVVRRRGARGARGEDVPRDAARCPNGAVGIRQADDLAVRQLDRLQCVRHLRLRYIVQVSIPESRDAVLQVRVVAPNVVDVALDAENLTERIMGQVVLAWRALDVAPAEGQVDG